MIGQVVSHYRILESLDKGGMGVVYLAEDTRLGRRVAVKFLPLENQGPPFRQRFLREARLASALNHPHIATIHDYGETEEGLPFIVMELVKGRSFDDYLKAGELTLQQRLQVIEEIAEALREAHSRQIIHRDIKPKNVIINEHGDAKVLDFGLARQFKVESSDEVDRFAVTLDAQNTQEGVILGTPHYMSPEQARGSPDETDARSDLFSLGVLLYQCLTNRQPFTGKTLIEVCGQVLNVSPPAPSRLNPQIWTSMDDIALKSLEKLPEARYQSAEEFLVDFKPERVRHLEMNSTSERPASARRIFHRGIFNWRSKHNHQSRTRPARERRRLQAPLIDSRIILWGLLLLVAFGLVLTLVKLQWRREEKIKSVAILPFVIEKGSENLEYIRDGISDSLISRLSALPELKVISRNSASQYSGREIDPVAVGSALKVGAILTGKLSLINGRLHIRTELVNARDRSYLWGKEYDKKSSDLNSAIEDILQNLGGTLSRESGAAGQQAGRTRSLINPEAHDLYAKGRWYWNKFTAESAKQAIQCFQQAIDIDPGYAPAYAGLADTYVLNSWVPSNEAYGRAKAAVEQALMLDSNLCEAHATLGFIKSHYERDWSGADTEYKRAIQLNPNYASSHHWYADHLLALGQFEDAFRELSLAKELDPLSPIINTEIGLYYFYTRRYDAAITHFQGASELFPGFFPAHYYLGWAYTHQGSYGTAIAEYEAALALSKRQSLVLAMLGYAYGRSGNFAKAKEVIRELEAISLKKNVSPYRFALVYTSLGDKDAAFRWLNQAYDERDIMFIHLKVSPFSDPLRNDARFDALLKRMGLLSE